MVDLHTHSGASDGHYAPAALVELARTSGLRAIALTDHDTLDGLDEAATAAQAAGIRFIRGIEIDIAFEPGEFHVLGLDLGAGHGRGQAGGIRGESAAGRGYEELAEAVEHVARLREDRNHLMLGRIREAGIPLTMEELRTQAGSGLVGRPHFADALVHRNAALTRQDAFDRYLAKGRPFYVAKECLQLGTIVDLVHSAGGLAVVAHPMSLFVSWSKLVSFFDEWKELGIDGIEAYHPTARLTHCRRLERLARERGFRVTAGSDYHGPRRPGRRLGYTAGELPIGDEWLLALERRDDPA